MSATRSSPTLVFISHSAADSEYANHMERILEKAGVESWNFNSRVGPGDDYLEKVRPALAKCSHIMVLVGPHTRDSRWVDMEMEVAMAPSDAGPGAVLIGVILPYHDDFGRPYYEPEAVPVRLHDFLKQEAATIRKWSEDPAEVTAWLEAADRRRAIVARNRPSLSTLRYVRERKWSDEGELARPGLFALSSQHVRP